MKKSILKGCGIVLGAAGSFIAANAAGVAYLANVAGKKMKSNELGNNMMYSNALNQKTLDINPDTDHAYINCVSGVSEVRLNDLPIHYDMYIELGSFCSVFIIKLPADVKVNIEGTGFKNTVKNMREEVTDESLPTVHLVLDNAKLSTIIITEV